MSLYRLDSIKENCILGSEFLLRVSPFSVDKIKMLFSCTVNNQIVICPLSFESQSKCKFVILEPMLKPKVTELYKIEHCIAYAETYKEKSLAGISTMMIEDWFSKNPNAF